MSIEFEFSALLHKRRWVGIEQTRHIEREPIIRKRRSKLRENRWLTSGLLAVTACSVTFIFGCNRAEPDLTLRRWLIRQAGIEAHDCGRATTDGENEQQTQCALKDLAARQPFFVQYRVVGIDAVAEEGFALASKGELLHAMTFSWGPSAGPKGAIHVVPCNESTLRRGGRGDLLCDER